MASLILTDQMTDVANEILNLAAQLAPNLSQQATNDIKTKLIAIAHDIQSASSNQMIQTPDQHNPFNTSSDSSHHDPNIVSFAPGRPRPGASNQICAVTDPQTPDDYIHHNRPYTFQKQYHNDTYDVIDDEITHESDSKEEESVSPSMGNPTTKTFSDFLQETKFKLKPFQGTQTPTCTYIHDDKLIQIPIMSIVPKPLLNDKHKSREFIMDNISNNKHSKPIVKLRMESWCREWKVTFVDAIAEMIYKFVNGGMWFGDVQHLFGLLRKSKPHNIETNPSAFVKEVKQCIEKRKRVDTIPQITINIKREDNRNRRWKKEIHTSCKQIDLFANGTYRYKDERTIRSDYGDESMSSLYRDDMCIEEECKTMYTCHCGVWKYNASCLICYGYGWDDWNVDCMDHDIKGKLFYLEEQTYRLEFNTCDKDVDISVTVYFK